MNNLKLTAAQQFVLHTLLSLAISIATGVGTVLIQYVSSHPFNLSEIIGFAALAFGGSISHGLLTLQNGNFPMEALQALKDTINQLTASHQNLSTTVSQLAANQDATPIVQVQAATNSASSVPTIAPSQQPVQSSASQGPAMPSTAAPISSQQFTAPVGIVKPQ